MIHIKKEKIIGPLYCISAALIWGLSFVAQKSGAHIGTFTFNGIRTMIGCIALIPVLVFNHVRANKNLKPEEKKKFDFKGMAKGGTACGIVLFVASSLQQHAFSFDIAAGKVGFITALYMMLVPIFGLALKKYPKFNVWIGVVFGVGGLYLLCVPKGDFAIGKGEFFALLCAVCFAIHILVIDHFCTKVDAVALSCGQFFVSGALGLICMFIFEEPVMSDITASAIPILYAGIGSCTLAFTFQVVGQKYADPTVAALLFCLESVFSLIFGWIILGDALGTRGLIGCGIMFVGIVLTQLDFSNLKSKKSDTN